jgi:hypothetical protein
MTNHCNDETFFKRLRTWWFALGVLGLCLSAQGKPEDYDLKVNVTRQGEVFKTDASFRLPLTLCQAYRFITDYDSATNIPGVVESKTTRLDKDHVRVERLLRERFLFFPIDMPMVLAFTERPGVGTDFVQISGQAKSYQGSWRLEPTGANTLFVYQTQSVPDSAVPGAVVEYFIKNRLNKSFEAMAASGAARASEACER